MRRLLFTFSWQELRHHPWRYAAAVVAVMLGVALSFSIHLINASALDEFSRAVRSVDGQPDLELRPRQGALDEIWLARLQRDEAVSLANPVLEVQTVAVGPGGQRVSLRVLGLDALKAGAVAPEWWPQAAPGESRLALLAPGHVFLNPGAQRLMQGQGWRLQSGLMLQAVHVAGQVSAAGPALAVMDIAAAQDLFERVGELSRVELRLQPGADRAALHERLLQADASASRGPQATAQGTATAPWLLSEPGDSALRASELSRAYRVNLTVLALVALFTGAFLVFSVQALSVAKRAQQFALLGVLGLRPAERMQLVLWESLALGLIGSAAGLLLGTGLAALALRLLGGDLGGGYFAGVSPRLQWSPWAAAMYGTLGVAAALAGGGWPAHQAARLPVAQALKGLGQGIGRSRLRAVGPVLVLLALALTQLPPVAGMPLAAYVAIALLLVGGIASMPLGVGMVLRRLAPRLQRSPLLLLAVERARRQPDAATVAVSGVVAALSLAVAITVMVSSFRASVTQWLDQVLPADLYARSSSALAAHDTVFFPAEWVQAARAVPGVTRVQSQRVLPVLLEPTQPAVVLIARELDEPTRHLPLVSEALPVPSGQIAVYVSEAMVDLYGVRLGGPLPALTRSFEPTLRHATEKSATFFVAGIWRDYARQSGTVLMDQRDYVALSADARSNDIGVWLTPGTPVGAVRDALRELAERLSPGLGDQLEFGTAQEIRAASLQIFDRSFAVTYWLQAVAIGIGLFGVAASFSAQVLARRKEFGLLAHLGLTRRQVLTLVALEGTTWTALGAVAGLTLGLAVAMVLVHVVNPQSFHWTMDLALPTTRLALLAVMVVIAGTLTAWLAGRAAAGRQAVLAVKEDW